MDSIREQFIKDFDEETADKIINAAKYHANGINNENIGSDEFKWALCIIISYQCAEIDRYRSYHGITKYPWERIKNWIKSNGYLDTHDGSFDYIALVAGIYNEYMPESK